MERRPQNGGDLSGEGRKAEAGAWEGAGLRRSARA